MLFERQTEGSVSELGNMPPEIGLNRFTINNGQIGTSNTVRAKKSQRPLTRFSLFTTKQKLGRSREFSDWVTGPESGNRLAALPNVGRDWLHGPVAILLEIYPTCIYHGNWRMLLRCRNAVSQWMSCRCMKFHNPEGMIRRVIIVHRKIGQLVAPDRPPRPTCQQARERPTPAKYTPAITSLSHLTDYHRRISGITPHSRVQVLTHSLL